MRAAEAGMPRIVAVGAGRMGRGIAIAFAYAGHRVSLVDLRTRSDEAWRKLADEAAAEIEGSLAGLPALGGLERAQGKLAQLEARVAELEQRGAGKP